VSLQFNSPNSSCNALKATGESFGKSATDRIVNPDKILLFIKKTGITRTDFAHALDFNHLIMNKIIVGQRKLPESVTADFARRIGLPTDWFVREINAHETFPEINTAELKLIIAETKHSKTKPVKERPVKTKPLNTVVIQDPKSMEIIKSVMAEHNIDEKTLSPALGCGKKCLQEKLTGETEIFAQDIFVLSRLAGRNVFNDFNIAGLENSNREVQILTDKGKISAELAKSKLNKNIKNLLKERDISIKTVEKHVTTALKLIRTALKDYLPLAVLLHQIFQNNGHSG